jgi:transcriptional regulator with XRE-family HTH domain
MQEFPSTAPQPTRDHSNVNATLNLLRLALIHERKARRISLRHLSGLIGCSRSTLSEFENGAQHTSILTIFEYAKIVELTISFSPEGIFRIIDPNEN